MRSEVNKALEVLQGGGIILYPTDTVWGIGCDATNREAVNRIYDLKQRQDAKAMLILLDSEARIERYIKEVPEAAWQLLEVADKPLTIIYPGAKNIAPNLMAEDGSIGIRLPDDAFCQTLLSRFKRPVVSTSANISGDLTPQNFAQISETIIQGVDYCVQWRQDEVVPGNPSSVIKIGTGNEIQIIRH